MRYYYWIICLLLALSCCRAFAELDPEQVMAGGDQYYAQQKYEKAKEPYQYFLEHFPDNKKREQVYYALLKCELQTQDWKAVIATVAGLQKDFPQSADLPRSCVWAFRANLEQGNNAPASAIFEDLTANNAGNNICWQLIEQWFAVRAQQDPDHAASLLDTFVRQHQEVLPADAPQRESWLRLDFFKTHDETKYLNEAINLIEGAKDIATKDGQAPFIALAGQIYRPLVRARRIADAMQVRQTVLSCITQIQPHDQVLLDKDQQAYLQALQQGIAMVDGVGDVTTAEKYVPALTFSAPLFQALLAAQQHDPAKLLHDSMKSVLARLGNPYALCHQLHMNYYQPVLAALPAEQLAALADATVATLGQRMDRNDFQESATLAQCLYTPLLARATTLPQASALHDAVLAGITRQRLPVQWARDEST